LRKYGRCADARDVSPTAAYDRRRILYNAAAKCPDLLAMGVRSRPVRPSPCGHRPCPETTMTRRCRRQLQSCRQMEGGTQGPDARCQVRPLGFDPATASHVSHPSQYVPRISIRRSA
jgi:hypothetical protein